MPLIFSFISSGSSSIVQYLRGFYCEPQNEGPESLLLPISWIPLFLPLCSSSLLVSFLCCSFQLLSPWQSSTPIWTVLKFLNFPSEILSTGTFWSLQFADRAWVRSAEVYTAGTIFWLLHLHSDTHLNKLYHPNYIPYFIPQFVNTRNLKYELSIMLSAHKTSMNTYWAAFSSIAVVISKKCWWGHACGTYWTYNTLVNHRI